MPRGDTVLSRLEHDGLQELSGSALGPGMLRTGGIEVLLLALRKILIPMVCAFATDAELEQYFALHSNRDIAAARLALAQVDLAFPPRSPLTVIHDRAIAAAMAQGLSEQRSQQLTDHALKTIRALLSAPTRT